MKDFETPAPVQLGPELPPFNLALFMVGVSITAALLIACALLLFWMPRSPCFGFLRESPLVEGGDSEFQGDAATEEGDAGCASNQC